MQLHTATATFFAEKLFFWLELWLLIAAIFFGDKKQVMRDARELGQDF